MSREWLAVYSAMATKPKYRRLSPIGRGALLHVFLLAGFQSPEATWADPEELRESLTLEGFPSAAFDELRGLGWIESLPDDGIGIHDWDAHQWAANKAAAQEWEASRKRQWRRRKAVTPPLPAPSPTEEDMTPHHKDKGPGQGPDMSGTRKVDPVVVAAYEGLFGTVTNAKLAYLANIQGRWPDLDRIVDGLRVEHRRGATRKDICGRLESGLKEGDLRTAADAMARIEAKVADMESAA